MRYWEKCSTHSPKLEMKWITENKTGSFVVQSPMSTHRTAFFECTKFYARTRKSRHFTAIFLWPDHHMGDRVIYLRDLLECMPHVPSIIAKWDSMQLLSCECFFFVCLFFEKRQSLFWFVFIESNNITTCTYIVYKK